MSGKGQTERRQEAIKKLEELRDSKMIVYMTSDRLPQHLFPTQIALDVIPKFFKHLHRIGKTKKISLFLYSTGGTIDAPWPLVNLIREYCNNFEILIPYKCHSAATMIALGADKIVMTPIGQLSPVDPSGTFIAEGGKPVMFSIEDVLGFVDFVKDKIGIKEQEPLKESLSALVSEIKPTYLGAINRTHSLIRRLSENLLKLHVKNLNEEDQIKRIVDNLTHLLFSHLHWVNRREAKDVVGFGNYIEFPKEKHEQAIMDCYYVYAEDLELDKLFSPEVLLKEGEPSGSYNALRAFIESTNLTHIFESDMTISKVNQQINVNVIFQGWREYAIHQEGV
jgi:hypothetical protein